ncbi:SgcJ/EcaC family oxidoreductase [Kitasatospora sp. NPDC004669]|uniref:SgcJ/EcaC family oxidoreductase n=1 Tax=Kitasatospora sp. NPDC004669 TaxID=3154555 RepID=UPI0033BCEB6C
MTATPPNVFEHFDLPDTELTRACDTYAEKSTATFVYNHSVRSYLFARAHARAQGLRPGTDYDDELLFVACVLHDIGLSEDGNGDQRFEVDGADTAAAFLRRHDVDEQRIAVVWDAIALHTSEGIAPRKGTVVALTQAGIGTDILGARRESLPDGLADDAHTLLPRMDLGYALTDAILTQALAKPHKASPMSFPGELLRLHLPHGARPTWNDILAGAGWGDRPTGAGARPRPQTPQELGEFFTRYLAAGDLDGLLSLYEPDAHFVPTPGTHLTGTDAIREGLRHLIDADARLTLELRDIRQVGDIALLSNRATLTGLGPDPLTTDTTEVVRRQPDGSWAQVIDDPFFH